MAVLDPVNTIAVKRIVPGVADNVFRNSPLLAMLRSSGLERYEGGPSWQENFAYGVLNGTSYAPGGTFDISQKQVATGATVTPRYYVVPVPATLEKLKIEMNGPQAVFDYVDLLLQVAALTMSGVLANAAYRHGQNLSGSNRINDINGLDEALNDGTNNGFDGRTYTSYLGVTRTDVDSGLNSPMTNPTANIAGSISYPALEQAFNSCKIGDEKPNLIITTNDGESFVKMAFQAQQRFESQDGAFGFKGASLNGAPIVADQYAPGKRVATAADTALGYSALSAGETIWFLNSKWVRLYVSTDPLFGFGFTGFLPAQDSSTVVGRYHAVLNMTVRAPRLNRVLFGITG